MQAYSNPERENDPHALPDVEVWQHTHHHKECPEGCELGWYWQSCFPGCLPDSEPMGPFATQAEALADAQQGNE